ncbi:MAG: glycosyltransferase, partial [Nitrospira sp.]
MRILHVSPLYYPILGGAELHLKEVSEGLAARGHEVTVLTTNTPNAWDLWNAKSADLPAEESIKGVKIVRLQPNGGVLGDLIRLGWKVPGADRGMNRLLSSSGFDLFMKGPRTFGVIPYVLRSKVDVVVSMNWYWPLAHYCHLARRLKSFRLVGIPLFHTAEDWCDSSIYRLMLRTCDAVIANTEFEAEFARVRGARDVQAVGVGIHPTHFDKREGRSLRAKYSIGSNPVV